MSENQSLPPSSDSPLVNSTDNTNRAQESSWSDADSSADSQVNDWEPVAIPGTIDGVSTASEREGELLTLIHDLNQCNDVLLSRVARLEGALEKSQVALESEVASAQATKGKMAQQVSVEQASAQQISHSAQQQIAKLVGKLDNTEQALSRQLLISENLQTEVNNYQERIAQLEKECTIAAQQHSEEVQARAKAEANSKDLRSRLQRQQRYTMQFKAALEKSLTVTSRTSDGAAQPIAFQDSTAVVMPKAQRIMPWVSDNSSLFGGIDPHLESLIRRVGKPDARAEDLSAIAQKEASAQDEHSRQDSAMQNLALSSVSASLEPATNLEAEAKLWQDIERVMNHAERQDGGKNSTEETIDIVSDSLSDDFIDDAPVTISEQIEGPIQEIAALEIADQADGEEVEIDSTSPKNALQNASEETDLIHQIESTFVAANRSAPEEVITFTEPSPWGKPLAQPLETQLDKKIEKLASGSKAQQVSGSAEDSYLPVLERAVVERSAVERSAVERSAVESRVDDAASLVEALRSQKQPGSRSNIELPTFRNAKVASFRR